MKLSSPRIELLETRIAPAFAASINVASLDGHNGFKISGSVENDYSGVAVTGAGDVNGDGFADFVVSAPRRGPNGDFQGTSYVIFGRSDGFGAHLELSTIDGTNGFKISGTGPNDYAGVPVAGAGDINGDGFDDLLIGTGAYSSSEYTDGLSYVILGKASGFAPNLKLSSLDGTNGFAITGAGPGRAGGNALSAAGDVNGDGFDDFVVGAASARPAGFYSGAAYVVFGKADAFSPLLDVSTLDGADGFKMSGVDEQDYTGQSVSGAGDVNHDGFADIIIGALGATLQGSLYGFSYVVFGHEAAFAANLDLSTLNGVNGFKISSVVEGDHFGIRVSSVGDFNGDGCADVIVGAPLSSPNGFFSGAAYVVFGKTTGFAANFDIPSLDGTNGFKISGVGIENRVGYALSGPADINGDGFDDIILGAAYAGPTETYAGASYVIFGQAGAYAANLNLAALNGINGFEIDAAHANHRLGRSVSGAGDINGDGYDDLIIGAPGVDPHGFESGASYVVFGSGPLSLSADGRTAHWNDLDGDFVAITTTKGRFTDSDFIFQPSPNGPVLERIDFTGHASAFTGASVTIKARPQLVSGSVIGDGHVNIGEFDASGLNLGIVKIGGDVTAFRAGDGKATGVKSLQVESFGVHQTIFPTLAAGLDVAGHLSRLQVRGDVIDFTMEIGTDDSHGVGLLKIGGDFAGSALAVGTGIRNLDVGGSIIASTVFAPGTLFPADVIAARAIGTIKVRGDVLVSDILAGYDVGRNPVNGSAGIGRVAIQGDFMASNLVAGVEDWTRDGFGRNDIDITEGTDDILAIIASVTIRGVTLGSAASGDFFGITAERIGATKIHGLSLALASGRHNDNFLLDAANNDFRLVEI